MNRDALISQLRIDRDDLPERRPRRRRPSAPVVGAIAIVLAAIGALAWFLLAQTGVPVRSATAAAVSSPSAAAGATLLDASGYVVAQRQATVSSKVAGKVLEVLIQEGQHVQAGQVIARLDDSNARAAEAQAVAEFGQAQANVQLAETALADANVKYQRYRGFAGQGVIAEQTIDDVRTVWDNARATLAVSRSAVAVAQAGVQVARRNIEDTIVRAPFSGVVTAKTAQPGEIVAPVAGGGFTRTGIGTIVDMDSLEVEVDIAESLINRVTQGMPAVVKLNAYPDWEIPAVVIAVIPTADRSKATVTVRVDLKTKDARIVPEMGARVSFLSPAEVGPRHAAVQTGVVVPDDAVKTDDSGQAAAFVIHGGRVQRRAVRLGPRQDDRQVVLAGLKPGENVAISEQPLTDGARVRILDAGQPGQRESN